MAATRSIFPTIEADLPRPEVIFVFPSEVAAAFWRDETARRSATRAVRADRFVSWDTFKEQVLQERAELAPVNRATRMLFADALIAENADSPFLSRVVDPRYATEADGFASDIESLLPTLAALTAAEVYEGLESGLRADVRELSRRYRRFLDSHGLFEPAWEVQRFEPGRRQYVIFHPRLITDFAEFEPALRDHQAVRLLGVTAEEAGAAAAGADGERVNPPAGPVMREYETSRAEIRDLCAHLETLLDDGVAPREIAITVCGTDAFLTYLEDACRRRSIPTGVRAGRPLTSYPAGRLFENLHALPRAGYGLEAMQALLLDHAVPWTDPAAMRRVIRLGIERGCLRSYREDGVERDVWLPALGGENYHAERELYRRLRAQTRALADADSFGRLRGVLYKFFGVFLDTAAWSPTQLPVFQSCLEELADLIDASERFGLNPRRPFDAWLRALRSRVYVPRDPAPGVAIYPYRVAAGIEPRYHFLVNASHSRMRFLHSPYAFLRDDEKERLGLTDIDLSDDYAAAYAVSGRTVAASYSRESFSGPDLPPSWFAERGLVQAIRRGEAAADPFDAEREYVTGDESPPARVYEQQLSGLSHMSATGFGARLPDWSQTAVDDDALRVRLRASRHTEEGRIRLSPSDVRSYRHCPFGYLLGTLLRLDPDAYTRGARAAADAGRTYHRGFERLFERILEHSGVFRREDAELYHRWVAPTATEVTEEWAIRRTSLSPAEVVALRVRLEESMHALIEEDARRFDGWRIEVLERYEWVDFEEDVVLGGFMDRRMAGPAGAAVIDYKKSRLPTQKAFRVDPADPTQPEELQLPLYAEILSRLGRNVAGLYLYSVEKARYLAVFGGGEKAVLDEEALDASRQAARLAAVAMLDGLRRGDFRFPDLRGGCESCSFPGICRARFVTG
ncbi:MAG: PD-(D/E)XK nuclease family protein [Spirochaetaceae bacterium]